MFDIVDLGTLGGRHSAAVSLNDACQVVGWSEIKPTPGVEHPRYAFLWEAGRIHKMGAFDVKSINNSGQVVGSKSIHGLLAAILWHNDRLKVLTAKPKANAGANAISDAGQTVGWRQLQPPNVGIEESAMIKIEAFLHDKSGVQTLPVDSDVLISKANAINNSGVVAGSIKTPKTEDGRLVLRDTAVLWKDDSFEFLPNLPGFNESQAIAINASGQVLCKATNNSLTKILHRLKDPEALSPEEIKEISQAFYQCGYLWDGEARALGPMTRNGAMDWNHIPRALNDQGQVVGAVRCNLADASDQPHAFLYHAFLYHDGVMQDLNDLIDEHSGWTLIEARSINNHGQIVGDGEINGARRAFLLTPRTIFV